MTQTPMTIQYPPAVGQINPLEKWREISVKEKNVTVLGLRFSEHYELQLAYYDLSLTVAITEETATAKCGLIHTDKNDATVLHVAATMDDMTLDKAKAWAIETISNSLKTAQDAYTNILWALKCGYECASRNIKAE